MPQSLVKTRVFVVDDEHVIAATLTAILLAKGFLATSFTNPLEVLKRAETEAPDLLISDVVMPELSGIDLAIQMQKQHPNCKVLLFSGQASTVDLLRAARERGYNFNMLSKPVYPADLLAELKSLSRPSD